MNYPYMSYYYQLANHYLEEIQAENEFRTFTEQRQNVNRIYRIIEVRYSYLLEILERYNVPPYVIEIITKRIIRFTLANADKIPGNINRKVNILYRQFIRKERRVILILNLFGVPRFSIERYIKGVIRATLEISDDGASNIEREVNRLLRLFEAQFPNYLGLTNIYGIPRPIARRIVRNIIEYTLRNINRISPIGSIQRRADQMLRLLDAERPDLIRAMIVRGVPAVRAEEITRRIIIFTLRNENL